MSQERVGLTTEHSASQTKTCRPLPFVVLQNRSLQLLGSECNSWLRVRHGGVSTMPQTDTQCKLHREGLGFKPLTATEALTND